MDTLTHITLTTMFNNPMQKWKAFQQLERLRQNVPDVPDEAYLLQHPYTSTTTLVLPNVPYCAEALACTSFNAVNKELQWAEGASDVQQISLSTYRY